jgi:aminoglycoside phosphotransferase (APT) family kinase protein
VTLEPRGPLLAQGRSADIFDHGPGLVLRRYREPRDAAHEARVIELARAGGFPAPAVYETGPMTLVLGRIDGRSMLDDLARRPWALGRHARTLAELHERLHRIPAPPDLPAPFGDGDRLVHEDLHPANVLLGPNGPVVIDWEGAGRGLAADDVAMTWIILATSEIPGPAWFRVVARAGRKAFLDAFLKRTDAAAAEARLPAVGRLRLADPHLNDGERAAVRRLVARAR